ncbi:MAG: ABC transporter permease subunit [Candidatus Eisenbacteria bacterium]|nr:ABC transporter permease subunit [Candidatus Eisenbacteria bacterium]
MSEEVWRRLLTAAGALFLVLFSLAPFLFMLLVSASGRPDFLTESVPFSVTLEHYARVLAAAELHFPRYLLNSCVVSLAAAAAAVLVASLAAYALTRLPVPSKMALLFGVLALSMFPQVSLVGHLFKMMSALHWINTYQALILPYAAWVLPLSVWIMVSYFLQIPRDLDRAAQVDGCSHLQVLARVLLPVARPGLFAVFLLAFIFCFNEFMFALMLTRDAAARTVPVGIALFEGLHGETPWGTIMAASAVTTVPVVAVTVAFQRHIISGLTRGAVKG